MSGRTDFATSRRALALLAWSSAMAMALILAIPGAPARAGITEFDSYKSVLYSQTSEAPPTAPTDAFYAARVFPSGAGQATDVYGVLGGTTPLIYSAIAPGGPFLYQTTTFATPAAMNAVFTPGSSASVVVSGGTLGTQTAGYTLAADGYSAAVPALTGGSYAALQGAPASAPISLGFAGFTPGAGANEADVFASITRNSDGATVYSSGPLSSLTTGLTLAANTLAAGTAYTLDLDYSSRVDTVNAGFGGATLVQAFDQRTEISFNTASVPEPSSLILTAMGAGLAALVVRARRSRPAA